MKKTLIILAIIFLAVITGIIANRNAFGIGFICGVYTEKAAIQEMEVKND